MKAPLFLAVVAGLLGLHGLAAQETLEENTLGFPSGRQVQAGAGRHRGAASARIDVSRTAWTPAGACSSYFRGRISTPFG